MISTTLAILALSAQGGLSQGLPVTMTIYGLGQPGEIDPPLPMSQIRQVAFCLGQLPEDTNRVEPLFELFRHNRQGFVLDRTMRGIKYFAYVDRTSKNEPRLTIRMTGVPVLKTQCFV